MQDTRASNRRLALVMLAIGLIGQCAYAAMVYRLATRGSSSSVLLPILSWFRVVPLAGWIVIFVRPGWRRLMVGVVASIAVVLFVYGSETQPAQWMPARQGTRAKIEGTAAIGHTLDIPVLKDLDGNDFDLQSYEDRPLVISAWRTWCVPCRKEMPELQEIDGLRTSKGIVAVIGVSDEPVELQLKARDQIGVKYRLVYHDESLAALQAEQVPTTMVVLNGTVIARWTGAKHNLAAVVRAVLEDPHAGR